MANTYSSLHYHLVFSTKNREPWFTPKNEQRIWEYLGGIARDHGMKAVQIGGCSDHIHALVAIPPPLAVSKAVQFLKGASSRWIHQTFHDLATFAWQDGYGAFTVGLSQIPDTVRYIKGQREHHRVKTFREEFVAFLNRHNVDFDEQYLLG